MNTLKIKINMSYGLGARKRVNAQRHSYMLLNVVPDVSTGAIAVYRVLCSVVSVDEKGVVRVTFLSTQ